MTRPIAITIVDSHGATLVDYFNWTRKATRYLDSMAIVRVDNAIRGTLGKIFQLAKERFSRGSQEGVSDSALKLFQSEVEPMMAEMCGQIQEALLSTSQHPSVMQRVVADVVKAVSEEMAEALGKMERAASVQQNVSLHSTEAFGKKEKASTQQNVRRENTRSNSPEASEERTESPITDGEEGVWQRFKEHARSHPGEVLVFVIEILAILGSAALGTYGYVGSSSILLNVGIGVSSFSALALILHCSLRNRCRSEE